jgi:hypothetical protein
MNAKNSQATQVQRTNAAQNGPANMLSELARQQLALLNDAAGAMFRGSEAVRKIQLQAAHRASSRHESAAARLRGVHDAADVMAIQSDLLRFDMEGATQYWQQMAAALVQAQVDMMSYAGHAFVTNSPDGIISAVQTWQSMPVNAPRSQNETVALA